MNNQHLQTVMKCNYTNWLQYSSTIQWNGNTIRKHEIHTENNQQFRRLIDLSGSADWPLHQNVIMVNFLSGSVSKLQAVY
jgi:hypothetical protein